jgi:hypothetical protein
MIYTCLVLTYLDKRIPPPCILLSFHYATNLNPQFKCDKFYDIFFLNHLQYVRQAVQLYLNELHIIVIY